ncbi:20517_t:CDS:1, partial [Dentiscutata erythropus]
TTHSQAVYTSRFISLNELEIINSRAVYTSGIINDDNKIIESQDNIPIEYMESLLCQKSE